MWPVTYPENTGPRHVPVSLEPSERTEASTVADPKMVHVDMYGNEVSENDPASQSKHLPAELKALKKGGFFPKQGDDPVVDAAADAAEAESEGTPVMNSGVRAQNADEDADADEEPQAKGTRGTKK